ncbi:type II toxin-antitoxin system RnlB family antitoxin [Caballeronia sp. LZ062]|uniref:type II toxin-antitoxin system RnlB family antitoxin n=1 Tax=unclassified Caballeronia TaxID=2646786 RepID=UPI002859DD00|nr:MULTISPECIES: type II toxin-antitoxin system RnlB family antitoxin [unclassified Caballeronia]MDR5855780.1 type II toxin-antitoxin system RnlB family antitoxin [Caballeronia sp. LZ050]MDR5872433.1 type II toxin-antitoxin system RnlB family antitoxin [Caballeronia sp. LZ062]
MNRPFLVRREGPNGLSAVVLSIGFENPMRALARVENDLRRRKVRGTVLFDLLLANGTKYNRFFVGEFDGDHFSSEFRSGEGRHAEFAAYSAGVYQQEVEAVDASLLTPAMRFALKRGTPL